LLKKLKQEKTMSIGRSPNLKRGCVGPAVGSGAFIEPINQLVPQLEIYWNVIKSDKDYFWYNLGVAEPKTKITDQDPKDFLNTVEPEQKRLDGVTLLKMFEGVTHKKAVMWGTSIVGFGKYHYKSERSRAEGDWCLTGFSPRKQNLTLYILHGNKENKDLLAKLGKHKEGGGCLYINKISDVDQKILQRLVKNSFQFMKKANYKDLISGK
jgi:hypothetical protein